MRGQSEQGVILIVDLVVAAEERISEKEKVVLVHTDCQDATISSILDIFHDVGIGMHFKPIASANFEVYRLVS